ncbi:MORN repeat-containing protein 1 isoform X2 [Spea bombifrons]|uniref:MORN repeat-containing protein 1 isoform X2 n=1 Tax=Spea bombifrons TaxID=233779 RepID=UPI00234B753D|nr:MORN repeat-containing protein 1 isoform X2 [Spea bombifrons]
MAAPSTFGKTSRYYIGNVKQQLRHGYGIYVYENSFFRYEGEWKAGKKHGHGKFLLKDGSYYEGEFRDGNTYSGEFLNGELHGHGVMQYKDGGRYEGEFVFGVREGHGMLIDKERQTYRGGFHKNKKNGEGQMSFKNGDHYEGDWVLDQRQGHGVLRCFDGTIYEGQWRNDAFNGQGAMIHCSGVIYDGLWINGRPAVCPKTMVILSEDIIEFSQRTSITFHVQVQNEEGEIAKNENGRVLRISAGIKYTEPVKNQSMSFLEVIEGFEEKRFQSPFGYECINYPLTNNSIEGREQKENLLSDNQSGCESSNMPLHSVKSDLENGDDGAWRAGDDHKALDDFHQEIPNIQTTDEEAALPPNMRTEMGCAVFRDIMFGPPPASILHLLNQAEADKNRGKKLSGKMTSEKTEKMTVSQEKIEDSRVDPITKESKFKREQVLMDNNNAVRPGEYVIMVEDITTPPFLGQTLPPAFKIIKIQPAKAKSKVIRKETLGVSSI